MEKEALYNFDFQPFHDSFEIGPFQIIINDKHRNNVSLLSKHAKIICKNNVAQRISSEWNYNIYETATIKYFSKDIESPIMFRDIPNRNKVDDLIDFLSFLTGRRIFRENQKQHIFSPYHLESILEVDLKSTLNQHWKNLIQIEEQNLSNVLYSCILESQLQELMPQTAIINAAYDQLATSWFSKNKTSEKIDKEITEKIKKIITDSISDKNKVEDIIPRIDGLQSTSITKKQITFLKENEYCPSDDQLSTNRIKILNKLRNAVIHKNDIKINPFKNKSWQFQVEIAGNCARIISNIVRHYLANEILRIDNERLRCIKDNIYTFFKTGKWRNFDFMNASFIDFINENIKE